MKEILQELERKSCDRPVELVRQQHAGKNGDNRDDDEEFDQGKGPSFHCFIPSVVWRSG